MLPRLCIKRWLHRVACYNFSIAQYRLDILLIPHCSQNSHVVNSLNSLIYYKQNPISVDDSANADGGQCTSWVMASVDGVSFN